MSRALASEGHQVKIIDPQQTFYTMEDNGWLEGLDIVVGRGRSNALLSLLNWAELQGQITINRQSAIYSVFNKSIMATALAAGNVKTPRTFFGSIESLAKNIKQESYPVILKPIFGDNSQGLLVVNGPEDLTGIQWQDPVALAQEYLPGDGYDLKLYVIGGEVWAVRKPTPFQGPGTPVIASDKAVPADLTPEYEAIGRRCGELFDLELYGVDCIETPSGLLVIEVNDFPNYTSVPEADKKLADYVIRRAGKGDRL
jgi:ribosomal protein S6--L-glutamate ligase